jgi:lipoprotein-releasing system ATP-binding protein
MNAPVVEPVVECRGVSRRLGSGIETRAVDDVSFRAYPGELVTLSGRSGSGKSTLLYLLGVLDRPTEGRILIDGVDIGALDEEARAALRLRKLGFVFQFHFLLPEFSAEENVMIPLLRSGSSRADARGRARALLEEVGLHRLAARKVGELSGGEQQRVSIARALSNRPRLILADEATGNLDTTNGRIVMDLFHRLIADGITVVLVTHEAAFAAEGTRRLVLEDGRLIAETAAS